MRSSSPASATLRRRPGGRSIADDRRLSLAAAHAEGGEAAPGVAAAQFEGLARAIEAEVRAQLQVRVAVTVLACGGLPKSAYKNSLLAVRESQPPASS